jgi:hypothetical protein
MIMVQIGESYVVLDAIVALVPYQAEEGDDWKVSAAGAEMQCTICLSSGRHLETDMTATEVLELMTKALSKQ